MVVRGSPDNAKSDEFNEKKEESESADKSFINATNRD